MGNISLAGVGTNPRNTISADSAMTSLESITSIKSGKSFFKRLLVLSDLFDTNIFLGVLSKEQKPRITQLLILPHPNGNQRNKKLQNIGVIYIILSQ